MTEPIEKITDELLPCPFCGSQPIQFTVLNAYKCESCQTDQGWMSKQKWNTRQASAEKDAKIKELEEELSGQHEKALMDGAEIRELTAKLKVAFELFEQCDSALQSLMVYLDQADTNIAREGLEQVSELREALKKLKG